MDQAARHEDGLAGLPPPGSGKARILAALRGEVADRVPFAPNIWQWYHANDYNDTLPGEARELGGPVEVLRSLGADILSKFDSPEPRAVYRNGTCRVGFAGGLPRGRAPWANFPALVEPGSTEAGIFAGGLIRNEVVETPYGRLTHSWEYRAETGAPFETAHWWKDFDAEYAAIRYWLEHTEWQLDRDALAAGLVRVGDDGTIIFQLLPSPLKQLHWLAGQVNASYFIWDHPEKMQQLVEIYAERFLAYVREVAGLNDVWIYEIADNLDSQFYPPRWFRQFCVPSVRAAAEILHAQGKYLFVHACGKLKQLAPLFLETGLDCVEGQAPPPIGDWPLHEARALSEKLIICGGMAAPEQELSGLGAAACIDAYVSGLFASLGDRRRFIFGSSCNTSPRTPYANLVAFRDAAWKYGGLS